MNARRLFGGLGCLVFVLPVLGTRTIADARNLQILSGAILLLTLLRPRLGLLVVGGLLPLTAIFGAVVQPDVIRPVIAEILLTSFLLAAGLRVVFDAPSAPPSRLARPALVLGTLIAAGAVLALVVRQQVTTWPLDFLRDLQHHLLASYFDQSSPFDAYHVAMTWIEGLTLAVFAERLLRGDRHAPSILIAGAAAAAANAWVRLAQISFRRTNPLVAAFGFLQNVRINTLYTDVNAAGSLFALYLVPAVWLALQKARGAEGDRGRWLNGHALAAVLIGLALWMTQSRAAYAGVIVGLAALWVHSRRMSPKAIGIAAAVTAISLITFVLWKHGTASQSSSSLSLRVRWEMAGIAMQITRQHPLFGVGLGEFRQASQAFVTPALLAIFPQTGVGENAHNNFLQILAELGLSGFMAFLWLLWSAARSVAGSLRAEQLALGGGVLAFLVTCLGGHPLLTEEVLWLFLLMLGAMAGLAEPHVAPASDLRSRRIAIALTIAILASCPVRLWQLLHADLHWTVIGAGPPTNGGGLGVYRRAAARSVWSVPNNARTVQIPLRVTPDSPSPCLVHIDVDNRQGDVVSVTSNEWSSTTLQFDPGRPGSPSRRLELRVDAACHLMVGAFTIRQ